MSPLLEYGTQIYFWVYIGSILLIATGEAFFPKRILHPGMGRRWLNNIVLHLIDVGLVRALFPVLGIELVLWADSRGMGLLAQLELPTVVEWVLTFVLLDLAYYLHHWMLHHVPLLWRLHRVHHTDRDYDFSTGLRFHPLEAVFTTGYKGLILLLLGPPPEAAALYIFILMGWSILVHANIRFPVALDRIVRLLLVTPDLHRTHHSAEPGESTCNLAAISPSWDKLFGSYRDHPARGQEGMVIGLPAYQADRHQALGEILLQPLQKEVESDSKTDGAIVNNDA